MAGSSPSACTTPSTPAPIATCPRCSQHRSRRPRPLSVHGIAILSTFVAAILASTPRSTALVANPGVVWRPSAVMATKRGALAVPCRSRRLAEASSFGGTRASLSKTPPRRSGERLLMVSSGGRDDGVERDGDDDVVVEGQAVDNNAMEGVVALQASSAVEVERGEEEAGGAVLASGSKSRKRKKAKSKRPMLEGEALRDELMRRESAEEDKVLAVNEQFYRARAYKEIDDLEEVWDKSELSECIRNVGVVLKGYESIMEEFKTEFLMAKKQEKPGLRPFKIKDLKVHTCGTLAWVTCIEDMRNPYKPSVKTVQLVTNVFRKSGSGWRLTRHHASDRDVSEQKGGAAVSSLVGSGSKQQPGGGDGQSGNNILSHFVDENGQVTEVSARMFRVSDGEIRPIDISELSAGSTADDEDGHASNASFISGEMSINDSDDDDEDDGEGKLVDDSPLPTWLRNILRDKVKAALDKQDMEKMEEFTKNRMAKNGIQAETMKEGVHWEMRNGIPVIFDQPAFGTEKQRWGDRGSGKRDGDNENRGQGDDDEEDDDDGEEGDDQVEKEEGGGGGGASEWRKTHTKETIIAIRRLADVGKINEREKQLLLSDIIRAASRKGPSITEVSFEVLVGGEAGRDFDASEFDEFVDHCKAFAAQLSEEQKSWRRPWWKFWRRG